jgi:hypothetical protein
MALPIPFLIIGAMDVAAHSEMRDGYRDFWADKFDSSLQHYTNATMLAPRNAEAFIGHYAEAHALQVRIDILEKLGRTADAGGHTGRSSCRRRGRDTKTS